MTTHECFSTLVPNGGVYVGFSSSHSSKSTIGGSMGLSEGFPRVFKTMWDNVGVEGAIFGRFQARGEREEGVQGFRARGL